MMKKSAAAALLAGMLAMAACGAPATTTTQGLPGSTAGSDQSASTESGSLADDAMADLESDIEDFATRVAASDSADEVRDAWNALAARLMTVVESAEDGTSEAREQLMAELDEFSETLSQLQVEGEVRSAWDALRARIEEEVG
jgi:gas vesicle protein